MTQESALYFRLYDLREKLAIEKKIPVYLVFPNKSLEEMAYSMPTTKKEFAALYGVGNTKLRQY